MKKRKSLKPRKLKRKPHPRKEPRTKGKPQTFVEFLRSSPLVGSGIDLTRKPEIARDEILFDLDD
jgi:hypothetical protein